MIMDRRRVASPGSGVYFYFYVDHDYELGTLRGFTFYAFIFYWDL